MARSTTVQAAFNSGILGVDLKDRDDLEEYYNGGRDLVNIDPLPGGGFRLRPGTAYYGRHRNVLAAIDLATATITDGAQLDAPSGSSPSPPAPPPDPPPYPDLPEWWYFPGDSVQP